MRAVSEHEFTTYPRRFDAYRWYKPLLVGLLLLVFYLISGISLDVITKLIFGAVNSSSGYDDMDFFTAAGAFYNGAQADLIIPCLIFAALIVKDRPVSSYYSSMGGWRWKAFLKTFAAGVVIIGLPTIVWLLVHGKTGDFAFTAGGFIILTLLAPLQGFAEELTFRGYIMQTVSSWVRIPAAGIIVQMLLFAAVHPYNMIGIAEIVISAIIYALICVFTKGIESASALHIINNMTLIYMAGFGFGEITADQTIPDTVFNIILKVIFVLFIIYADRKLHWFDEVRYDDVAEFNAKGRKKGTGNI